HCVNLLPIRNEVSPQKKIPDFLKYVSNNILDAIDHQEFTFGSLLKELTFERDLSRIPLVSVIFNIDLQPPGQGLDFDKLKCHYVTNPRHFENFEMFINVTVCGDEVNIENQFNTSLFSKETIASWMSSYQEILKELTTSSNEALDEINVDIFIPEYVDSIDLSNNNSDSIVEYEEDVFDKIRKMCCRLLGVEDISSKDNFFHLGGHSLLAGELMVELRKEHGFILSLKDIFNAKTVGHLASMCSELSDDKCLVSPIQKKHSNRESVNLSIQQFRVWYVQTVNEDSTLFNLPSFRKLGKNLDVKAFQKSLFEFIDRHPVLNANIVMNSSTPMLKITKKDYDFKVRKEHKDEKSLYEALKLKSSQNIDLAEDHLFSPELYQTSDGEYYLYMLIHHILWDGWCYDIFQKEMTELYKKNMGLDSEEIYSSDVNYLDYNIWQKELIKSDTVLKQKKYWLKALEGDLPVLDLPVDYKRPSVVDFHGQSHFMKWEEEEIVILEAFAKKHNTTLFNVLLTGLNVLLHKYTGDVDFIIGMPVQGRHWNELNHLIGFFASNIAIRTTLDINTSFSHNLLKVKNQVSSAYSNSDIPFDNIVRELNLPRDSSRTPLYQCFFMYQDATNRTAGMHDLPYITVPIERGACHTDLDFWARRDPNGMSGGFDFMTSLFKRETIERMALDYREILRCIGENGNSNISDNNLISPLNLERLLSTYNSNLVDLPRDISVHGLFEKQVLINPDKVCVSDSSSSLTYKQLNEKSNQLAHYLVEKGVREDDLVGVAVKRDINLFVSIFGIWKAGAGYVPLEPDFPKDRLFYMIDHSKVKVLVTNQEYENENIFKGLRKVIVNSNHIDNYNTSNLNLLVKPAQTCYVIYTSGSTGKPKGVQLGQSSVVNFLLSMKETPGIGNDDVLCAITTLSFDISVLELYLPLISGASVVIVDRDTAIFGDQLATVLNERNVSIMQATPASWRLLLDSGWKGGKNFKVLCGGEPFPKDLAHTLLGLCESVWNMYGPTETTVWSTCKKLSLDENSILIGRPINNTTIFLLDDKLKPVPQGVTGNLFIGGKGLALGYLNRKDLTDEKFIQSPFSPNDIIYDTGDLARYDTNGNLECLGRNDGQVKVRGYRIELGEIESVLASFPGVKEQVVIVREDRPGDVRIVAYYISQGDINVTNLRQHLQKKLPNYMIPSHFIKMDRFPMTLNEKIDRKSLPSVQNISDKKCNENIVSDVTLSKTEEDIHQIWCELLSIPNININHDFFDVGGHSLLSVELFGKIFDKYGLNLPLSVLFDHGSISKLAAHIDHELTSTEVGNTSSSNENSLVDTTYKSLVLMRPGTGGKPVFFFHGVGGNVLNYRILFKSIPSDRPIYGLQSTGIDGVSELCKDFDEMITEYSLEIMSLPLNGPLTFIGGSMGGLVAYEVANFLSREGEDIEKLIMLDTFGPNYTKKRSRRKKITCSKIFEKLRCKLNHYFNKASLSFYKLLGRSIPHDLRFYFVELNNFKLMRSHKVSKYEDHLIMIRGRKTNSGRSADPNLGWDGMVGSIEVHYTDSTHDEIVESKDARVLLKEILSR
ncbi:amino acid adenylation domain-containing protein, partial [Halobacteriovorax sp.]|uniref:amino acid adenylation domain-containing protein n=1 Tax=Halobacteriovorax sp. TaxID=2020862 RepID=UPI003568378E